MSKIKVTNTISPEKFAELLRAVDGSSEAARLQDLKRKVEEGAATYEEMRHLGIKIRHLPVRYEKGMRLLLKEDTSAFEVLEAGSLGVLLVGGNDGSRGAMAAALAVRKTAGSWNATRMFIDVPELIDKLFSLPLYGSESSSSVLAEIKGAEVLTLHGIAELVERPKASPALEEILKERVRRANGFTIVTSELDWSELKACMTERLGRSLRDLLLVPSIGKLNGLNLGEASLARKKS